jgi:hypothetical protein
MFAHLSGTSDRRWDRVAIRPRVVVILLVAQEGRTPRLRRRSRTLPNVSKAHH